MYFLFLYKALSTHIRLEVCSKSQVRTIFLLIILSILLI